MNKRILIFYSLVILVVTGCGNEEIINSWRSLGLDTKLVGELKLDNNYIYACASRDGLFRLDLQKQEVAWEYLGFADSTLPQALPYGVTSIYIDQTEPVIIVGIATPETYGTGVFLSNDNGITWVPSDSGIQSPRLPFSTQVQSINGISSPKNVTLIGMSTTIFKSNNDGSSWNLVYGNPDAGGLGINTIKFNPATPNEIWAGGGTGRFAPFLLHSTDYGDSWNFIYPLPPYGSDNAIYDIAVDTENHGTVYLGMLGLILKTPDYGQSWERILFEQDGIHRHWRLNINPTNSKELLATGARVYHTLDGGSSWDKIDQLPDQEGVYALEVNWDRRILYVSTSSPNNAIYTATF